ncbi:MAG: hypothetical protein ACREPZ_11740 [Rhodanobacteraceae bacterium]
MAAYGPRVSLVVKADIRPGHDKRLTGKVESLESAIADQDQSAARNGD